MERHIKKACVFCFALFLLNSVSAQQGFTVAILPFTGVNVDAGQLKQASTVLYQELSQEEVFQFMDPEDMLSILKEAGFNNINASDETALFTAGSYLGVDLLITGVLGKGFEEYNLEIKVNEINSIFTVFHKTVSFSAEDELLSNISKLSYEILTESSKW